MTTPRNGSWMDQDDFDDDPEVKRHPQPGDLDYAPWEWHYEEFSDDVEDTGYSPEDRETLRRDWEQIYYARYDNAPPDLPIALSDAELEAAEAEDREFQTEIQMCRVCGQFNEACQCGSEE